MTGSEHLPPIPPKPSGPKRTAKKWLRYGAYGFLGGIFGLAGLIALAGSGPVLRMAIPFINETVSDVTDSRFEVGRIEGSLWTGLTLDQLAMDRASDGFYFELDGIEFDWSPLALLGGRVQINRVDLAHANVILPDGVAPETVQQEDDDTEGSFALPLSISLGALELGEVAIVDPVSGNSFLYSLSGKAKVGTNLSATAFVDLQPRDGGTDRLELDLAFDGGEKQLSAEINGVFGQDGLVMTLAGLDPQTAADITITLNGDGPPDDWKGKLELTADGYGKLSSDIGAQLSSDVLAFSLDGELTPLERIAQQLPKPLHKTIDLGVVGAFDQAQQTLSFDQVFIAIPEALSLTGTTALDLEKSDITADLTANLDPNLSTLLEGAVSWGQLDLSVMANGNMAMPGVAITLNGQDITTPVSSIANVTLHADMPSPEDEDETIAVNLMLSTSGTRWDDETLAVFLGAEQNLSLDTLIAADFDNIAVRNLVLNAPDMALRGQADIEESFAVSNANLVADIRDLAIFAPVSGLDLDGQGRVSFDNLTWSTATGLKGDVGIAASQAGFGITDLDRIIGTSPAINGVVTLSPDLDLNIDVPDVQTTMITGPMTVDITDNFGQLAVEADLDLSPGVVTPGIGVSITPSKLSVRLDGAIAAPPGMIDFHIPGMEAGGQQFDEVQLGAEITWSDRNVLSLINQGRFIFAGREYDLNAKVVLPNDGLHVENITLEGKHIALAGDLVLPDYNLPMRGAISLSRLEAELLDDFAVPFANGSLLADVGFEPDGARQTISVAAKAKGLRMVGDVEGNPTMIEDVTLDATIADAFETPKIAAKLEAFDIVADSIGVNEVALDVTGGLDQLDVTLDGSGLYQGNVTFKTDLVAEVSLGSDVRFDASRFDAVIGDQAIALRQPLQFVFRENGSQQLEADLTVGTGQLSVSLNQKADLRSFAGNVKLSGIDLAPWGKISGFDGLGGTANLDASLHEETGRSPTVRVNGRITGITAKAVEDIKPFEMLLDVTLEDGTLEGQATLGNGDVEAVSAKGTVPFVISVLEQQFSPDLGAPVSAVVRLNGEIAEFWPYVPAPDHQLSGKIKLAVDVAGTLDDIRWKGDITLADGHYENLEYGTILDQMTLDGIFDQNGLSIPSFTATDGGNGTAKASVELNVLDDGDVSYDVSVDLRDVALSRKDELRFWADVRTNVTGSQHEADIKSTVSVQRGEVDLALALPESVPTIEIENLPATVQTQESEKNENGQSGFKGNLDVTVDIPGRLFVRGKGLDSEWGGRLEVRGTTDAPQISGQLSALRGQIDVIGKTFVIKDSMITFAGGSPPDPMLDIEGVYTAEDLEVKAGFKGPSSDPELVLTSNPSLPKDEILSQVLFGKSQGSLSAIEAVQLASALNQLSGRGGGLDIVGQMRRFIGADVLQLGGGENGPEVKVGKYLTEGVYVGTKAGSTPGSSGIEVEVEVTPNISVTSETTENDNKAGVQYRLDY